MTQVIHAVRVLRDRPNRNVARQGECGFRLEWRRTDASYSTRVSRVVAPFWTGPRTLRRCVRDSVLPSILNS
jgi:hypothetical protein